MSEFNKGATAMRDAMLCAFDAHAQNIELGFPIELVFTKLREHINLISVDMIARQANQKTDNING